MLRLAAEASGSNVTPTATQLAEKRSWRTRTPRQSCGISFPIRPFDATDFRLARTRCDGSKKSSQRKLVETRSWKGFLSAAGRTLGALGQINELTLRTETLEKPVARTGRISGWLWIGRVCVPAPQLSVRQSWADLPLKASRLRGGGDEG